MDKWKDERKKENIDDIEFQYVRSMSHLRKKLCNKASIRIQLILNGSAHRTKNKELRANKG